MNRFLFNLKNLGSSVGLSLPKQLSNYEKTTSITFNCRFDIRFESRCEAGENRFYFR